MSRRSTLRISVVLALAIAGASAVAEPMFKLDRAKQNAVELSNLSPSGECVSDQISGRVVSVEHDRQGSLPVAFTIEHADGTRTHINVDEHEFSNASRLAQGWVADGLQRMVRKGKHVAVGAHFCGAAGRVIMLDSIRQ